MRPVAIIEFPSNLGLKMPRPGHEPGVKKLPAWLKKHGFHEKVKPSVIKTLLPPSYSGIVDPETGVRNTAEIIQYALQQEKVTREVLAENYFPVIIGGDCSILIGSMLALKKMGRQGLFFLDGHTDFMPPGFSQTGGAAGMDLAIVTGHGHDQLVNIEDQGPYVQEEHVWCVGNREYDEEYENIIRESAITYYNLERLRKGGIRQCVDSFFAMLDKENMDGFWVHIDADVLNDDIMPAVDSRSPGGLLYNELEEILKPLLSHPKVTGIQVTILDPELDPDGRYTKEFVEVFAGIIDSVKK